MSKPLTGRRILVVEDEMLVVMMIEGILEDLGSEAITAAATVDQALRHIEEKVFDVAMLDMNLAGTGSELVADALVAHQIPFLYSTGNTGNDMRPNYSDRPVLRKPFKAETLEELLTALLLAAPPAR